MAFFRLIDSPLPASELPTSRSNDAGAESDSLASTAKNPTDSVTAKKDHIKSEYIPHDKNDV